MNKGKHFASRWLGLKWLPSKLASVNFAKADREEQLQRDIFIPRDQPKVHLLTCVAGMMSKSV